MAKPDIKDIEDDKTELERAWIETHAQWAVTDTFTNGKYIIWSKDVADTRSTERTNRGRSILDHVSDNLLPYAPKFTRNKVGQDIEAQDDMDAVEVAATELWIHASQAEMQIPSKIAGRYMAKYNYAIFETGFDDSDMPENSDEKHNYSPFRLFAPHPFNVLLPPNDKTPDVGVKRMRWYRRDLKKYLDKKREASQDTLMSVYDYDAPGNAYDMIDVVTHVTPEYTSMTTADVGNQLILQEENPFGLLPFTHAWGGFGDMEANMDGINPVLMGQGILYPAQSLLIQYDQVRSAKMELYMKAAYGILVTSGSAEELASKLDQVSSSILGRTDVREIGFLPIPQLPQFLADLEDRIDREIVDMTIPRPVFGGREVGVDTVGQHAMMVSLGMKRFIETMEQMSFMTAQVMTMWFRMLDTWGHDINVRGSRLSSAMLRNDYHITAGYPQTDEAVRMQRIQQGADLVGRGLKSRKRHWEEDQGLDNPSGESDQLIAEAVMADPIMTTALAEKKRRELGLQDIYNQQLQRLASERQEGFAQTQADSGLPGFSPPANEAQGQIRQALTEEVLRPAPASAGTGQGPQ